MAPVVLITGAAGGIGGECVRRFRTGGWRVVGVDIAPGSGGDRHIQADLRNSQACRDAVSTAAEWAGRLDCVINAAGVWSEGPSEVVTDAEWDRVIDLNLKGTFFVCSAAIPYLRITKGCVVNVSSDAGIQGNSGAAVYCASKGGVSILTKALALELAPSGVRVNAVCPGDVDSPMLRDQAANAPSGDSEAYLQRLLANYPQRAAARFTTAGEVAELIWFLAQPAAAPITGTNLSIDFGLSAGIG